MATKTQIDIAFRRAGFVTGRPVLKDGEEMGKVRSQYPDNREALISLYSDDVVKSCLSLAGEETPNLNTATDESDGFIFRLAAQLVDVLVSSGMTQTGRPRDISGVQNGELITTFVSGDEGTRILTRRASDLRAQSLQFFSE